jgi:dTDP-4-dehydrorhamnose 3,5-epimerase
MSDPYFEEKKLNLDGRGMLYEIARKSQDGDIRQVYVTGVAPNVIKAWHLHKFQVDRFCCIKGTILVGIHCPDRNLSWSYILSEHKKQTLTIPPHLWHGFTALWGNYAEVLNCTSSEYDGRDEFRKPWDAFDFDWTIKNG